MHAGTSESTKETDEETLTDEQARAKIAEAVQKVDWMNFALVMDTIARGHNWNKYDNAYYKPNYQRAEKDAIWVGDNANDLRKAMDTVRKNRNADN